MTFRRDSPRGASHEPEASLAPDAGFDATSNDPRGLGPEPRLHQMIAQTFRVDVDRGVQIGRAVDLLRASPFIDANAARLEGTKAVFHENCGGEGIVQRHARTLRGKGGRGS